MSSFKNCTIKSWILYAQERLEVSNSRLDAELLLLKVLNKSRNFIYTDFDYILSKEELESLEILLSRRVQGEPIAYITGFKEFWSLNFKVTPDVLIPRPETELLVENVLLKLSKYKDKNIHIADIGTGSGAIALSIAKERPNWTIHAVDLSDKALKVAKENADRNNIKNVIFYHADLFSHFDKLDIKFDAIVSNPPYIDINDEYITHINSKELKYEPKMALIADNNGMSVINKLINDSPKYLTNRGYLLFEHGYQQQEEIKEYLKTISYKHLEFLKDLNDKDRVVVLVY